MSPQHESDYTRLFAEQLEYSIILLASLLSESVYLPMFTRANTCVPSALKQLSFIAKHMEKEMSSLVSERLLLLTMAL